MKLRIATYNIHKGVSTFGGRAYIHDIKQAIHQLDADLIFLQEVQGQHDFHAKKHPEWPKQGQHEFLAGESHSYAYGMNAIYTHGHHGNALLSRLPIIHTTNRDVSDHVYEQRGILHVAVQIDGIETHCFVLHLGLFAASRRRQIHALIQQIQEHVPKSAPLIIAGDFNDWGQNLSRTLYQELEVMEAFDAPSDLPHQSSPIHSIRKFLNRKTNHVSTFPAMFPCFSLDRVYLRGFTVHHAQVLTGTPWNKLSDHVPLRVDLQLNQAITT